MASPGKGGAAGGSKGGARSASTSGSGGGGGRRGSLKQRQALSKMKRFYREALHVGTGDRSAIRKTYLAAAKRAGRTVTQKDLANVMARAGKVIAKRSAKVQKAISQGDFKKARLKGEGLFNAKPVRGGIKGRVNLSHKDVRITKENINFSMRSKVVAADRRNQRRAKGYKDFASYKKANPTRKRRDGESRADYLDRVKFG